MTFYTHTDFREYIDFFQKGVVFPIADWQFKLKLIGADGTQFASMTGVTDPLVPNRAWFSEQQSNLANLPEEGVTWYLLAKDPDDYIRLIKSGSAGVSSGPLWE